jgi:hypothetical protein
MYRFSLTEEANTGNKRSVDTVRRIGSSVFNAVFTTFLAVTVLSQAKSFVFYSFFQVLALVNILSGATGIFILPVVLAIVHGGSKVLQVPREFDDESDDSTSKNKSDAVETSNADATTNGAVVAASSSTSNGDAPATKHNSTSNGTSSTNNSDTGADV